MLSISDGKIWLDLDDLLFNLVGDDQRRAIASWALTDDQVLEDIVSLLVEGVTSDGRWATTTASIQNGTGRTEVPSVLAKARERIAGLAGEVAQAAVREANEQAKIAQLAADRANDELRAARRRIEDMERRLQPAREAL